jgi:5'-3' exonuclease
LPRGSDAILPRKQGWQHRYYRVLSNGQEHKVRRMVITYLSGIAWVYSYYTGKKFSWKWFYEFDCAPLLSDVLRYGQSFRATQPRDYGRPIPSQVQLMCVLPPQSYNLLPAKLQQLLLEKDELRQLCPECISENAWYKDRRHETIPCLPSLDVGKMLKLFVHNTSL